MLDVDFGTYPFTTSSHVIVGGSTIGTGIAPRYVQDVAGVVKAYTTRVGEGPMPTELTDGIGNHLQEKGHEFGTTTSRPRRCGWLDLVVVKHACMLSGISKIAITKLDVLNELDTLKICTGYKLNGKTIDFIPSCIDEFKACVPIYKEMKGWKTSIDQPKQMNDLPKEAKNYLKFIQDFLNVPIAVVSTGPERNETFEIKN
jgi:adenylosuccinate synthase